MSDSPTSIDVVCGPLTAKLFPGKLASGYSRCISFGDGGSLFTPCDFERKAGRGASKNWKKTIRFKGKSIGCYLEPVSSADAKKGPFYKPPFNAYPFVKFSRRFESILVPSGPSVLFHAQHRHVCLLGNTTILHRQPRPVPSLQLGCSVQCQPELPCRFTTPPSLCHVLSLQPRQRLRHQSSPLCHLLHPQQVLIWKLLHP